MYDLYVEFVPEVEAASKAAETARTKRRVGFRTAYLKTTSASASASSGSGDFTMRLQINGAPFFARGSNFVPLEELEGRLSSWQSVPPAAGRSRCSRP